MKFAAVFFALGLFGLALGSKDRKDFIDLAERWLICI